MRERIVGWIKEEVRKAKAGGAVVGMSGGVDSSLVAVLCKQALGPAVLGMLLPCHTDPVHVADAEEVARKFDIATLKIDLSSLYDHSVALLSADHEMAKANIKPRLRMTTLYYYSNRLNYLVVGTGNKSELMVGYFTKHGDGGVDILPIGGLLKSDVRRLASEVGIPERIINKPPTAGLWPGQTDEGELGISYDDLDTVLWALEEGKNETMPKGKVERVKEMIVRSSHKRRPPAMFQP